MNSEVVCLGELLIDFVALESGVEVGDASGFQKAPGGAPANVAVAIERLGHESAFLGQVGDDPFGHFLADVLDAEGVDVSGLRYTNEARTPLAFVSLTDTGERSFVFFRHPSADMLIKPEDVALDVIEGAQFFHFGSITLIDEPSRSATLKAAQHALDHDLIVSYDPNLRLALWPDADSAREGILAAMDYARIVKINDEELQLLSDGGDISALWHDRMELLIVTHGENGSTAYTRDGSAFTQPSYKVKTVDTTGAGDGFVAGLLVGILENKDDYLDKIESILRFSNAVGALTTTQRGAIPALPMRGRVDTFVEAGGWQG